MSDDLACMNCRKPVPTGEVKFFAEVFLCGVCNTQAVHLHERLERELKHLLVMSKEAIRISLVKGEFSFPEGPGSEVSKREVLEQVMLLEEARAKHQSNSGS